MLYMVALAFSLFFHPRSLMKLRSCTHLYRRACVSVCLVVRCRRESRCSRRSSALCSWARSSPCPCTPRFSPSSAVSPSPPSRSSPSREFYHCSVFLPIEASQVYAGSLVCLVVFYPSREFIPSFSFLASKCFHLRNLFVFCAPSKFSRSGELMKTFLFSCKSKLVQSTESSCVFGLSKVCVVLLCSHSEKENNAPRI